MSSYKTATDGNTTKHTAPSIAGLSQYQSRIASSAIVSEKLREIVRQVGNILRQNLDNVCTDQDAERIGQVLASRENAGSVEMLKLLVQGLPRDLAERMPELLESMGASPSTVMVSNTGKESVHRIDTAIQHLNAFLALTDLHYDVSNRSKWR